MEVEKSWLIKMVKRDQEQLEAAWEDVTSIQRIAKHSGCSIEARKEGNKLFLKGDDDAETRMEIFNHYNRSISLAPVNSEEMALAYGNRSAFLLRLNKYQDCNIDIDRALEITTSDLLRSKLYCRKVECFKNLGSSDYKTALEKAELHGKKVDEKNKKSVVELIAKAKACPVRHREKNVGIDNVQIVPETDDFLNRVAILHNEKYGRYLVAKKDYSPGDIIFVEKLYDTMLNQRMYHSNCNYCLKICWSGIPCNHCSWAMFCSEDCKKKAWDSFHDIECRIIPYLKRLTRMYFNKEMFEAVQSSLRTLLVGLREAGGINRLKEDLRLIDECADNHLKGFIKNGQILSNSIQCVYTLTSDTIDDREHEGSALISVIVLMILVEHSHLLPGFDINKVEDLLNNEDSLFIGCLLMKFFGIKSNNSFSFSHRSCYCKRLKSMEIRWKECCESGFALAPLASLINHSCFANAGFCFTEDRKIILYAEHPIKKDTQIYTTYVSHYFHFPIEERRERLKKYNFECDCLACMESWPPFLNLSNGVERKEPNPAMLSNFEKKLFNDCRNIFAALENKSLHFKKKDIKVLSKAIVQSIQQLKQPSSTTCILTETLDAVFSSIYGLKSPIELFDELGFVNYL